MEPQKRAQSSLEYLVTYGWAIFILVLIIAIMWYMGVFNNINIAGPATRSTGFSAFQHIDHKVNTTGAVIILANSITRSVTINSVSVGVSDGAPDTVCTAVPTSIGANGNFTITCTSLPQGGMSLDTNPYDFTVTIGFTDGVSGNAHTEIGSIRGKIGN